MASSSTPMTITTFKNVASKLPPDRAILIRADHGTGKSSVVRQIAAMLRTELKKPFPVIDERLGQKTEGDIVGLPSTDGETTRFNPPDRFKTACNEPCVVFFDELNRGTTEVMQSVFQIVLDRELNNGDKLHPETRVYAAINTAAQYTVNEIDPALLDRFFVIDLEPTAAEFVAWGRSTDTVHGGSLHEFITDFIEANETWLRPAKNCEASARQPSPRSWKMVDQSLKHAGVIEEPQNELFYHITRGFVGNEAAMAFRDFCKTVDNQISGDDILEHFSAPAVQKKMQRQSQERLNGLIEKLADHVNKVCDKPTSGLTDEQGLNVKAFMQALPDELKISLWAKLIREGTKKIALCKSVHKHCHEIILTVFGVKPGEAGIGMVANVPSMLKNQPKSGK